MQGFEKRDLPPSEDDAGGASLSSLATDSDAAATLPRSAGPSGAEIGAIASDIRAAAVWFAVPLGVAALVRLALERQYWSGSYLALLVLIPGYALAQRHLLRRESPGRIRLTLFVNWLAIGVGYTMIGAALNTVAGWRADTVLYRIERDVFGRDPQLFLVRWHSPWLSTVAILGYVSFVLLLIYLFLAEAFRLGVRTGRLQLGLMRLYGLGYAGYLLVPAAGPLFHNHESLAASAQTPLSAYLDSWVIRCCSGVDAWPSLHAAVCCFALGWTFRHHRGVFYLLLLPAAALLVGTVYFQFHYFIDLLAGGVLGTACVLPHGLRAAPVLAGEREAAAI